MHDDCPDWPEALARRYIEAGYWREETFFDAIRRVAADHPQRIALADADGRVTYGELIDAAARLAAGLYVRGLRAGDNVLVQFNNRIRFVEVLLALFRLGACPILALPAHRHLEILGIAKIGRPRAFITEDARSGFDFREIARRIREHSDLPLIIVDGEAQEFVPLENVYGDLDQDFPAPRWRDIACIQLSGGTTGVPKLIPHRHMEFLYKVRASADLCGFDKDTVYLVALPAAHNFPLSVPGFLGALLAGGMAVFTQDPSPDACFDLIQREGVTATALVPPLAMIWAEAATESTGANQLTSLRLLQVGGAKLGPQAAARVRASFSCTLQQAFGMAEGLLCYTRLDDPPHRLLETQGRPLCPDDEIRIVDDDDNPVDPGQIGALLTRGPYTIPGYYRAKEHNRVAFTDDGFFRTGDRVRIIDGGYIVVEGRDKDQINRGGEKIAPEEIENILLVHPDILDAAVVAIPDPSLGERICAFIIARSSKITASAVKDLVRQAGVAAYKTPDRIEFVSQFPQTGVGKISRRELRQELLRLFLAETAAKTLP